jgi:DNA (cytosine-5)-methyltransferase 1
MKALKVNDLFCGGGGFGIAFKQAGFDIAGAWDWEEVAVTSYNHNIGEHAGLADIREMTVFDLPDADVWSFGFPCQDLSKNGKMAGLNDGKKSKMFFEVMRLLKEFKGINRELPRILLAENVPGLDKYMDVLTDEFEKAGYKTFRSAVVSKYWGVPQNRERRYVVGVRNDISKDFVFPEQQTTFVPKLKHFLDDYVDASYFVTPNDFDPGLLIFMGDHYRVRQATAKGYDEAYPGDSINVAIPKSKTRRGRVGKQIAQTFLTSREQLVVLDDLRLRWITPREVARLQGFPEDYEIILPDPQAYFIFGNAVTVNVAQAVAERIKMFLLSL